MFRMLRICLCTGLLFWGLILLAQEPVVISGDQAVRFEQSPGFFHYAALCRTAKEFMVQMPAPRLPADTTESAVCWYVKGSKAGSPEVDGKLVISAHHIRFMPHGPQAAALYADLHPEEVELKHDPGQPYATLLGKGLVFTFRFSKLCPECAPGTAVTQGFVPSLLDQEFRLLDEGIRHFDSGWKQIYRLSAGQRPGPSSPSEPAVAVASTAARTAPAVEKAPAPKPAVAPVANSTASAISPPPQAPVTSPRVKPVRIASRAADGLLLKKVSPAYPIEAKLVRLEGTVVLRAVIDKTGEVSEVYATSGPPLLESAAVEAVKQWQYRPYSMNGQPVDVETTIQVVFALDGSQPATRAQTLHK